MKKSKRAYNNVIQENKILLNKIMKIESRPLGFSVNQLHVKDSLNNQKRLRLVGQV